MALRCRQIERRGLKRKTVMIDGFHVSNNPLYKFSAKNMTKCPRVHFGFFLYHYKQHLVTFKLDFLSEYASARQTKYTSVIPKTSSKFLGGVIFLIFYFENLDQALKSNNGHITIFQKHFVCVCSFVLRIS